MLELVFSIKNVCFSYFFGILALQIYSKRNRNYSMMHSLYKAEKGISHKCYREQGLKV